MPKFLEDQFPGYNPPYGEEDVTVSNYRKHSDDPDYDRGHHESDAEVRERFRNPETPKERLAVLTVSIDVTLGGYTGQRDSWEQFTEPYKVSVDGDKVILAAYNTIPGRKITFDRRGLESALKILEDYQG